MTERLFCSNFELQGETRFDSQGDVIRGWSIYQFRNGTPVEVGAYDMDTDAIILSATTAELFPGTLVLPCESTAKFFSQVLHLSWY